MTHQNGVVGVSSAVFEENVALLSQPWRRRLRHRAKTLTFSNISVIIEDIYLKLRVVVHYQKGEPIPVGEVILYLFFLTKLCPFFDLEFSKCSYS